MLNKNDIISVGVHTHTHTHTSAFYRHKREEGAYYLSKLSQPLVKEVIV